MSMDKPNPKTIYAGHVGFSPQGLDIPFGWRWTECTERQRLVQEYRRRRDLERTRCKTALKDCRQNRGAAWPLLLPRQSRMSSMHSSKLNAPKDGLYRSDDSGHTWTAADRSAYMIWRPFYFANLIVDPKDENKIYKTDGPLIASAMTAARASAIFGRARTETFTMFGLIRTTPTT